MPQTSTIYDQAVHISEGYLGPAGERFMRRQISTHLGIEPEKLNKKDLDTLADWVGLAFAVLTNNRNDVDTFTRSLQSLTSERK